MRLLSISFLASTIAFCGCAGPGSTSEPDAQPISERVASEMPSLTAPPPLPPESPFVHCSPGEATITLTIRAWSPTSPRVTRSLIVPLRPRRPGELLYAFEGIPPLVVALPMGRALELSCIGAELEEGLEVCWASSCPSSGPALPPAFPNFIIPPGGYRIVNDGCLGISASYTHARGAA